MIDTLIDDLNETLRENSTKIEEICTSFTNDTDIQNMCNSYMIVLNLKVKKDVDLLIYNLIKIFYPFLLIVGLFGNTITFLTMMRIYIRRKNYQKFCFSLGLLALADLLILTIACLREYLEIVFGVNIRSSSVISCKIITFFCYLFSFFSVYLHGFIAVERWLAVSDPIKSKSKFTFRISRIIIFFIFLVCVLLSLPLLYFPKLEQYIVLENDSSIYRTIEECSVIDETAVLSIDSIFYCLIPFVITILFSGLTVFKLIQSKTSMNKSNETEILRKNSVKSPASMRRRGSTRSRKSTVNYDTTRKSFHSALFSSFDTQSSSSYRPNLNKMYSIKTLYSSNVKITIMLMALPICYLITTFPIFMIIIYSWFVKNFSRVQDGHLPQMDRAYAIAKIFMYVHNSINILVYIFFGKSFRQDFIVILSFKNLYNKIIKTSHNSSNCDISQSKIQINYQTNEINFLNSNLMVSNSRGRNLAHFSLE